MKWNLDKLIENKRALTIVSLIIATIIWGVVVSFVTPISVIVVHNVPVDLTESQTQGLDAAMLSIVEGGTFEANVTVEGERMLIGGIKPEEIEITADLTGITTSGTYETVKLSARDKLGREYTVQSIEPSVATIRVDRLVTKRFALQSEISGLQIPDEYITSDVIVSPTEVTIVGPEADIAKIERAVVSATFDSPLTNSTTVRSEIVLYDSQGNVVNPALLNLSILEADITVPVLKQKELPIVFDYINIPTDFPAYSPELDYRLSKGGLMVAGPETLVDSYRSFNIGYIDIKEVTKDKVFMFDVDLPTGLVNMDNIQTISVWFEIADMEEAVFTIKNIKVINVPANYKVSVITQQISNVNVIGTPEILQSLSADDFVAEIDLSERDLGPGSHIRPVRISIPGKGLVWATGEYTAAINVQERESSS